MDELGARLTSAKRRLRQKLSELDLASVEISDYNRRYLGQKVAALDAQLDLDADLLSRCLSGWTRPLAEFRLVDYGGGIGVLAFLAKEVGIGTVVYEDIYDVSCRDAERVAQMLGLGLDHVVCGDVEELVSYLRRTGLTVNAIASYDVLEHIYDVEAHFRQLASAPLAAEYFRLVYGSGANIKNRRYVQQVMKAQRAAELEDRAPEWGHKERDALRAFIQIRREMISAHAPNLPVDEVEWLARATRGLRQDDIEKAVDEYEATGTISYRPEHPTNTCDPYTGNWSEHLMEPRWLASVVHRAGFTGEIFAGRYAVSGSRPKRAVKQVLNLVISIFGRRALAIAPFYGVYVTGRS